MKSIRSILYFLFSSVQEYKLILVKCLIYFYFNRVVCLVIVILLN